MKIAQFVILLTLLTSLTINSDVLNPEQTTYKVAIVYSSGGLGDKSYSDAAKQGIDVAKATYGSALTVDEACTADCTIPDITSAINTFADSGTYDLIIGVSFTAYDGITFAATADSSTNFMILDGFIDLPNVASIEFKEEEGSFLAGAMAAMVTQTKKLGFLGGLDIPLINRFGAGYMDGIQYMDPSIEVNISYSPDPNNPWGDLIGGKTVGESMIAQGIDIIYTAAGGTSFGVFNAVEEENDAGGNTYAIGVDSDQDYISQGNVLTSVIKRIDKAVEFNIDDLISGEWIAGSKRYGLADQAINLSNMTYTQDERNAEYQPGQTRYEKIEELTQQIINKDIIVKSSFNEFTAPSSSSSNPSSSISTPTSEKETNSPQSSDPVSLPVPLEIWVWVTTLVGISVVFVKYKNKNLN